MKKINIQMALMWIFAILPSIVLAMIYKALPEKVVIHIGINGSLRYGDKKTLWILSAISIFIAILFVLLREKAIKETKDFNNEYYAVGLSIVIFMFGMIIITILNAFKIDILPIQNVVCFCFAILFGVLGSIIKRGSTLKIMNRWTKRDYIVLEKTKKLAGEVFVIGALIQAIATIFTTNRVLFIIIVGVVVFSAIIPNIASYIWYKKRHKK